MAKKQTVPTLVPVEEQPYPIPANWRWVRLSGVYEINPHNKADDMSESGFVPMEKISAGMKGTYSYEVQPWKQAKKGHTQFADGDVAFAKISPCFENGKSMIPESVKLIFQHLLKIGIELNSESNRKLAKV